MTASDPKKPDPCQASLNDQKRESVLTIFDSKTNGFLQIDKAINASLKRFKNKGFSNWRLLHNHPIAGLSVDLVGKALLVRSHNADADAHCEYVCEILKDLFTNQHNIFIKNDFFARTQKNLERHDRPFYLSNATPLESTVNDEGFLYTYNASKDSDLFPLHFRSLRKEFNQQLRTRPNSSVGLLGAKSAFVISQEIQQTHCHTLEFSVQDKQLFEITDSFRHQENKWDGLFWDMSFWKENRKNRTALFHALHALLKALKQQGLLALHAPNASFVDSVLRQIISKERANFKVKKHLKTTTEPDFKQNAIKTPKSIQILIEITTS